MTIIPKRHLFLLAGCFLFSLAALFGQTSSVNKGFLSFSVKVAEENSPLYSSPDKDGNYMTGRVKAGEILEVCFRTDDGWCAVRPPEGSFSWINADYVLRGGSGIGTVVCPDSSKEVPVRVGAASILSSSDVQVGLENGRQVQILGEQTLTGNKTWLKIAPPRGEFRWIQQSALEQSDFLSQIPRKLTRYGEMIAENASSASHDEEFEYNAETFSRLDEEKIDPNAAQNADITDPIRKVSFDNNFNRELAILYRDLLTAIESSESDEAFEYLSRRGAALESMATDENQRSEAQKVNAQIRNRRQDRLIENSGNQQNDYSGVVEARPVFQSPIGHPTSDSEQVLFAMPHPGNSTKAQSNLHQGISPASSEKHSNKVRFAFAPRGENGAQALPSEKKSLFSAKPSAIVPPANYTYPAPAQLKVSSPSDTAPSQISPEGLPPSGEQSGSQTKSDTSKMFIEQDQPSQEIRQVSALFVKPDIPGGSTSALSRPVSANQNSSSIPTIENVAPPRTGVPDITGVLGFLPNSSDGTPSYALISKNGNQNTILCYVVPQQGKSLDPYVGKKIAVNGTRGWFKKGEENRKMIVAESVRIF